MKIYLVNFYHVSEISLVYEVGRRHSTIIAEQMDGAYCEYAVIVTKMDRLDFSFAEKFASSKLLQF